MDTSQQGRLGADIKLPRPNAIWVVTVTTAQTLDLANFSVVAQSDQFTSGLPTQGSASVANSSFQASTTQPTTLNPSGFVGHWIDICSDGADMGYIAGPTSASVSGANAPVLATTGTPGTAGTCMRIFNGTVKPYYVSPDERFLGVVSAGTTTLRIALSSR